MDNIRYKMLELLVYKHVIITSVQLLYTCQCLRMQQAFFFHKSHQKVQKTLSHPT